MLRRNIARNQDLQRIQERIQSQNSIPHNVRKSWPEIILGCVALLCGTILIVWNEARAVRTTKLLEESISSVTQIFPDYQLNDAYVGKLIFITGPVSVLEPLTDVDYGVSVVAVKLKRRVQMYQWVEEESTNVNIDGDITDTSYFYYMDWKDKIIDSSFFQSSVSHRNPKEFPIKSQNQINENVKIGNFALGTELKNMFSDYIPIASDERPERKDIKLHSGLYYHAKDVWNPKVGDIRIQFSYAGHHGQVVTVAGKLDSSFSIVPLTHNSGFNFLVLTMGCVSIEDLFAQEHAHNKFQTWLYRGGAWFLLYLGCVFLTNILNVLIYRFRLLRDLLPSTDGSLKMIISMSIFLFVTAVAWMWYRPALGLSLVIAMVLMLFITKNASETQPSQNSYNRL